MLRLWQRKITIFVMGQMEQDYRSTPIISIWAGKSVMEGLSSWAGDTASGSVLLRRIRVSHYDEAELAVYIRIHIHTLKAEQTWQLVLRGFQCLQQLWSRSDIILFTRKREAKNTNTIVTGDMVFTVLWMKPTLIVSLQCVDSSL